jgi:hypothetical protein
MSTGRSTVASSVLRGHSRTLAQSGALASTLTVPCRTTTSHRRATCRVIRDAVPGYDSFEEATVAATGTDASTILELGTISRRSPTHSTCTDRDALHRPPRTEWRASNRR